MFRVTHFQDYHEGAVLAEDVKKHLGIPLKAEELGFESGIYIFLLWTGTKPSKKVVDAMLKAEYDTSLKQLAED